MFYPLGKKLRKTLWGLREGGGHPLPPLYVRELMVNGAKFMPFNVHSWLWSNHGYIIAGPFNVHSWPWSNHGYIIAGPC